VLPPEAVKVALVIEHEMGPLLVRPAVGTLWSPVTVVLATAEQPLLPTTVTEYTPAVVTVAVGPLPIWLAPALNW
jgi:hypothetical protein